MTIGKSAVNALLVVGVFYDITRMAERECHFVARHSEKPAQTVRHGVEVTGKMGGVAGGAAIVYHVFCGHDG